MLSLAYLKVVTYGILGSIASSIGSLTTLTKLDFAGSSLVGIVPSTMGSLVNLEYISLRSNLVSGIFVTNLPIPSYTSICMFVMKCSMGC